MGPLICIGTSSSRGAVGKAMSGMMKKQMRVLHIGSVIDVVSGEDGLMNSDIYCVKCGEFSPRCSYHIAGYSAAAGKRCGYYDINTQQGEHLHFYCQNCLYDWTERCL